MLPLFLLAQGLPDGQGIASLIASLGGGGFALWFAYYAVTVLLPRLQEQHREHVKEVVTEFREESKENRELYREESRTNRETTAKLADSVDALVKKVNCPPRFPSPPPSAGS